MQSTDLLNSEHDVIERVLGLLDQTVDRIQSGTRIPDGFPPWSVDFFRRFADRCHHAKEEDVLFPLLEQRGIAREGGPIGVMLHEHTVGRECVARMDAATRCSPCHCEAFAEAASEYAALLREHIAKENNVLFMMAERCLSEEDDRQVTAAFHQAEHEKGGCELHERFQREIEEWERRFAPGANPSNPSNGPDYQAVLDSYHRCEDAGGLFDTFYDLFFAKSPEIRRKFAGTDMEMQKQVVMASLLWMLRLYKGDPIARAEVEKLAESHNRRQHDVRPELYEIWLDSLCEAIAKHDPQHTPQLDSQWRRVMRTGIELMQSKY